MRAGPTNEDPQTNCGGSPQHYSCCQKKVPIFTRGAFESEQNFDNQYRAKEITVLPITLLHYPFTTPIGLRRATFLDIPAP